MKSAGHRPLHARGTSRSGHWTLLVTAAVIALTAAAILASLNDRAIGLFHDDGLYAVAAQSLALGQGYRIPSLPGAPRQTKYPPLYSAILSVVWAMAPPFPGNVLWLKAVNVLFVVFGLVGAALWARSLLPPVAMVLFVALIGTSPGIVTYSDYTMTDVPFVALVLWYLYLWSVPKERQTRTMHVTIAAVTTAAVLTRSVGIALVAVTAVECAMRRDWRRLLGHVAVPLGAFAAWSGWAGWNRSVPADILSYYVEYETSALGFALSNPEIARDIIAGNALMTLQTIGFPLGPGWRLTWPLLVMLAGLGAWRLLRMHQRVPLAFAALYTCLVLLHPFSPHRYLLALLPVLLMAIFLGIEELLEAVSRSERIRSAMRQVAAGVVGGILLVPNLMLVATRNHVPPDHVRGWYWRDMGYTWDGFEQSFEWIRRSTPADAKLATMFDPTYFLFTGRQAVRPWLHHSHTYFYPVGRERPFVGMPHEVLAALRGLGVDYVILDPATGYAEGEAAMLMLREMLRLPEAGSNRVFVSSDGMHEIYRLSAHAAEPTVDRAPAAPVVVSEGR